MLYSRATQYFLSILVVYMCLNSVFGCNTTCPTWFYCSNTTHHCKCGESIRGRLYCHQEEGTVEIADLYCATSVKHEGQYIYYVGYCPFKHTKNRRDRVFSQLPSEPDMLNNITCGPYNRKGLLCGKCIDGYGPAVYSFDMKCINCSKISTGSAISLYVFLEFFPITLFFMCVVIFHFNITAGPLLGYVLFCQGYVFHVGNEFYIYEFALSHLSLPFRLLSYISLTLCSVWVLQFFRFLIPPFCISEKLSTIHTHMLTLVTSIYPVVLVVIVCILIHLYAKNYRIISKPCSIILKTFRITSLTRNTVFHTFATFIMLSASSITYNVSSITTNISVYQNLNGTLTIYKNVLYYDPLFIRDSHKHTFYLLLVLVFFIIFIVIPSLLLCVYPTRIYGCLSRFVSARKRLAITAFVEALNNCFKDGLNGTQDYRALAGFITVYGGLFGAIANSLSSAITISLYYILGFLYFLSSFVISYVRPCKSTVANLSLSYHFMVAAILNIALGLWKHDLSTGTKTLEGMFIIIPFISHILIFLWIVYTSTRWIMSCFGYHFNFHGCKVALIDLARVVKRCTCRERDGYQVLSDTVT